MKKEIPFKIFYLLAAVVVILNLVITIRESAFFNIEELPSGRLLYSCESPQGKRTLNVYRVENALGTAIRGEVVKQDGERQNVFWQTNLENVEVSWLDDSTVVIDSLILNVAKGGSYDCRRGTSLFQEGAVEEAYVTEEG